MNAENHVTDWSRIEITEDGTKNMTQNQAVSWQVPSDWNYEQNTLIVVAKDYGGGQFFGSSFNVRDGGRLYVVRVRAKATPSYSTSFKCVFQLGMAFRKSLKDLSSAANK
ncbi:hypothetical protein OH492_12235 [Vibrio chagasii]|nr:hypothetical protein [Vibrio chagasii]